MFEEDNQLIGMKRNRNMFDSKKAYYEMIDFIENLFAKNQKMTYEEIDKEIRSHFGDEDTERYLKTLLDKHTKMFSENGVTYYFRSN